MQSPESRIVMMSVATTVCVGLCVAIWFVTPEAPVDGCAVGAVECRGDDPFCLRDPAVPDGICTRLCSTGEGCPEDWCCVDHLGGGDRAYFVCAPPQRCPGGQQSPRAPR